MNKKKEDDFYNERHINYAKAKAYMEVTVQSLKDEAARWRIFAVISLFGLILALFISGYVFVSKELVPILVKYNEKTGQVTVSTVDAQEIERLSAIDALYKHWITKFITCSETYDKEDQLRLYECVKTLTDNKVFSDYRLRFERDDKDNWFERYGKDTVSVNVISINKISVLDKKSKKLENPRWIIKFEKEIKSKDGQKPIVIPYSAVMQTKFVKIARNEKDIRVNPLNFKVYSYRVDRETTEI
jgi:type IV secretory pathway component VirB8